MESSKTVIVGGKVNTTKKMNEGKLKSILSKIGIGAAGVAGGALLTTPVSKLINMVTENNQIETLPDPIIVIHDQAPKAYQVTDDMSLKDALMVAREEVGPGGTFIHKGNTYSTYTKEEENAMTDSHKQIFAESTNHMRIENSQISEADIKAITLDGTHQYETTDHQDVHPTIEPLDEMLADVVVPLSENVADQITEAPATADVASEFVEPLDEMLADVVVPLSENVADQITEAPATADVASGFVEPLDEMLADVVVTSSENVAEKVAEAPTTADVASEFVEPLDEMLVDVVVPLSENVADQITEAPATADVASEFVEPLDEMLADVVAPLSENVAEQVTETPVTADVASGFVEPLDEMLADVVVTSSENVAEQVTEAPATADVASGFVEPLDEMLADVVAPLSESVAEKVTEAPATADVASGFVEPLDEMLADVVAPLSENVSEKVTEAPATADVASGFVEPLDEMLADVVVTSSENVAEQVKEAPATATVASGFVEPLDEMLADVVAPSLENVAEKVEEAPAPATVASEFVEPLDGILADSNDGLNLIGENWVVNEIDGSKDHVVYYTQNGQSIIKIDQNNDGVFDTVFKTQADGSIQIRTSNGEEVYLTEQELEKVIFLENKEDVYDVKSKHTFVVMDTDSDGETDSVITSNSNGEVHISSSKGKATLILDDVAELVDAKDQVHHAKPIHQPLVEQDENDDSSTTNHHYNDNSATQTDYHPIDDNDFNVSFIDDI